MNLTYEEFELASGIVEECLKLEYDKIFDHIQSSVTLFSSNLDMLKLDDRNKLYSYLQHQSSLFMNYDINADLYLFSVKEKNKAIIGLQSITKIRNEFRLIGI